MAVEQQNAPEAVEQRPEQCVDRLVVGPVSLVDPLVELSLGVIARRHR